MQRTTLPPIDEHDDLVLPFLQNEITQTRAELSRVDSKTGTLLAVAGVAASALATVATRPGPVTAARVVVWMAVLALGAAVVLLVLAIRPRLQLPTGHVSGFARYADADVDELLEDLRAESGHIEQIAAAHLIGLSGITHAKYEQLHRASTALLAAGGLLGLAVVLAGLAGLA